MPARTFTQSIPAAGTFDPLETWQYQYTERAGVVSVIHNATALGLRAVLTATEITLMQDSPVPGGGTSGVIPSALNVAPVVEKVGKGKRLSLLYTNPTGGAIIVNGIVDLTYGGRR